MNKKGLEILHEEIIFIFLVVIFYSAFFIFVSGFNNNAAYTEQVYAKKIALLIDQAKPGTSLEIDVSEVLETADKNKLNRENTIEVDTENKEIIVRASKDEGYSFNFFSSSVVKWGLETKSKKLILEIE